MQGSVAISFLVVTWFFIALRVWTRTCLIANFGWDDSTMILAGVRQSMDVDALYGTDTYTGSLQRLLWSNAVS